MTAGEGERPLGPGEISGLPMPEQTRSEGGLLSRLRLRRNRAEDSGEQIDPRAEKIADLETRIAEVNQQIVQLESDGFNYLLPGTVDRNLRRLMKTKDRLERQLENLENGGAVTRLGRLAQAVREGVAEKGRVIGEKFKSGAVAFKEKGRALVDRLRGRNKEQPLSLYAQVEADVRFAQQLAQEVTHSESPQAIIEDARDFDETPNRVQQADEFQARLNNLDDVLGDEDVRELQRDVRDFIFRLQLERLQQVQRQTPEATSEQNPEKRRNQEKPIDVLLAVQLEAERQRYQLAGELLRLNQRYEKLTHDFVVANEEEDADKMQALNQQLTALEAQISHSQARTASVDAIQNRISEASRLLHDRADHLQTPEAKAIVMERLRQLEDELLELRPPSRLNRLGAAVRETARKTGKIASAMVTNPDLRDSVVVVGATTVARLAFAPAHFAMAGIGSIGSSIRQYRAYDRAIKAGEGREFLQEKVAGLTNKQALDRVEPETRRGKVWRKSVDTMGNAFMFAENVATKVVLELDVKRRHLIAELGISEDKQFSMEEFERWYGDLIAEAKEPGERGQKNAKGALRRINQVLADLADLYILGEHAPVGFGLETDKRITAQDIEQMYLFLKEKANLLETTLEDIVSADPQMKKFVDRIKEKLNDKHLEDRMTTMLVKMVSVNQLVSFVKAITFAEAAAQGIHLAGDLKDAAGGAMGDVKDAVGNAARKVKGAAGRVVDRVGHWLGLSSKDYQEDLVLVMRERPEPPVHVGMRDFPPREMPGGGSLRIPGVDEKPGFRLDDLDLVGEEPRAFKATTKNLADALPRAGRNMAEQQQFAEQFDPDALAKEPVWVNGKQEPVLLREAFNKVNFPTPSHYYAEHAAELLPDWSLRPDGFGEGAAAQLLGYLTPEDHFLSRSQMKNVLDYYVNHANDAEKTPLWNALNELRNGQNVEANQLVAQTLLEQAQ